MTDLPDLGPAARLTASIVSGVRDDALDAPTPCPAYSVRDLMTHLDGLSIAFTAAARKDVGAMTDSPPDVAASALADGWRERVPAQLELLAEAWRSPDAWQGMTRAGGVDLPGEAAGIVALDEVVLHGWDLAAATGQAYEPDHDTVAAITGFLTESRKGEVPEGLFGPVVDVGDATGFAHTLGLAGRDPEWRQS